MRYVPIAFITGQTGKNVKALLNHAQMLFKQNRQRVSTADLNRVIRHALEKNPPPLHQNRRPKIYYGTQVSPEPPAVVLFCNEPTAFSDTYRRRTFTEKFEYPELPVPVAPRYRGFHRFDLTTCIGCDQCAKACPINCIYIHKEKNPQGKGFRVNSFMIDYTKCMFCALCVEPCPVDCIFMGATHDLSC